ncbi:MAG: hypothetical protein MR627_00560 [Prevotella sp.]|nr:hypothetical protein [Prevotella sp.]
MSIGYPNEGLAQPFITLHNPSYQSFKQSITSAKDIHNILVRSVTRMTGDCHKETERLSPVDRARTDSFNLRKT